MSHCETGVDLQCKYLARPADVTYPEFATFNGWTDYSFGAGNSRGLGTGYDYYAIFSTKPAVSGRLADRHGKGIPAGGIKIAPGVPTPDVGYYRLVLKPGKYIVAAGDPIEHVSCKRRTLRLSHNLRNFNLVCKRG